MTTTLACPKCKTGRLSVVTDGLVGDFVIPANGARRSGTLGVEVRWKAAPFFACNECECCLEIQGGIDAVVSRDVPPRT